MKSIVNSNFKNSLMNLNRSLVKFPLKGVRSAEGIRDRTIEGKRMEIEDVVGLRTGKVGIVELNKEHKSNVLSNSFMEDIRRSLEAMEIDEDMKVVLVRSKKDEVFSFGTDLNYLYYSKKNGQENKIDEYFQNLYNFQNFVATYHKPLLTLGTGILKGSGVSFLASSSFPMSTLNAQASFPEVGYGYVPDGGSVFFLSRLDGELGAFLALTGYKLVNWDLVKMKLAFGLTDPNLEMTLSRRTFGTNFNDSLNDYWKKWPEAFREHQAEKNKAGPNGVIDFLDKEDRKKIDYFRHDDTYTYPWERKESDKEGNYKSQYHYLVSKELEMSEKSDTKKFNYKDYEGREFTNSAEQFLSLVYSGLPILPQNYFSLAHVTKDIDRLFRFETVKEIREALMNDPSPFAEWCLQQLEMKSPLALEVTLKMLRQAKSMNYYEIIKQELNVAKNIVMKNKDFDLFMENKIRHSKEKIKFPRSLSEITQAEVDEMFLDSQILSKIKLDVKPNAMLPHNRYLFQYPDCFRLWINENPRANEVIRKHFDYEIKNFLIHKFGIDMRDTNLTIEEVRRVLSTIETKNFVNSRNIEKVGSLISNNKFIDEYVTKRREVIDAFAKNKEKVMKVVDRKLSKVFEESLLNKSKEVFKNCEEIRDIEKRRTWIRLKKWLFMNRIMEYKGKQKIIRNKRIDALGHKNVFIPYELDVNYRDAVNPHIKKSAFYQLAGLFNLKKISPEYAMRFSTSNDYGSLFNMLEINKDKLTEIKEKLKTDSKSFIDVWNSLLDKEAEQAFAEIDDPDFVEYEKVYRLRHEGHSTLDKLPYYKEYVEMKNNWMEMKRKSTELLRKITLDIIHEVIEQEESYNKNLRQLSQDQGKLDKETYEDIKTLYNIVRNDEDGEKDDLAFFSDEKIDRVKIIKQNIDNCIKDDEFYQALTKLAEQNGELFSNFKNKVQELTQNIIMNNLTQSKSQSFKSEEIEDNLRRLFNDKAVESESESNDFIDWLYVKYGTQNMFAEILKKSKFTVISLLKNLVENEIFMHSNKLLSDLKQGQIDKVKVIYDKEKSLLEDTLKKYFEVRVNILDMDLMLKLESAEGKLSNTSIEDFINQLKEISFSHLVLTGSSSLPKSFEILFSKVSQKDRERELIEIYVNLKDAIATSKFKSHPNINYKDIFTRLTLVMQASDWYGQVKSYVNSTESTLSKNIDGEIENFIKTKFNEIVYENKIDSIDYLVDKRKLNEIIKEKFDMNYFQTLLTDYSSGKVSLNEDKAEKEVFSDPAKLEAKLNLYVLRGKLNEKLNKLERQFNIENLKTKYSDYIFNANHYIHKILCNIKNPEEIFSSGKDVQSTLTYGKFLFEIKNSLDETYFNLSSSRTDYENFVPYSHVSKLKSLLFNRQNYLQDLEKLNEFLKNKIKYNEQIMNFLYDDLPFTSKYEINLLINDIQTDSEKLCSFLKANPNGILNKADFVIPNEAFFNVFTNINFDDFIGLEGDNFAQLNEMNKRIKLIFDSRVKEINSAVSAYDRTEVEALIRNLISFEVLKGSKVADPQNFESLISDAIERERKAYDDLIKEGKLSEDMRGRSSNRDVYLKELVNVAGTFNEPIDVTKDKTTTSKTFTKNFPSDKFNVNINHLSSKVLSTIQGLKHLEYIKNNPEIAKDPNNLYSLLEITTNFEEFCKKQENPGLKFNRVVEIILGRKFSLQELIVNDRQKTISEYGNDPQFDKLFTKKLPVDLIKSTLEVFDARLIKALKYVLANQSNELFPFSELVDRYQTPSYLNRNIDYVKNQEASLVTSLDKIARDLDEEYRDMLFYDEMTDELKAESQTIIEGVHKEIQEIKDSEEKYACIDSDGSRVLRVVKKNSVLSNLVKINQLPTDKRRGVIEGIVKKVQSIIPVPDFSSQYTLLKYVYDYHMGSLQVAFENNREESERRMIELSTALRFEQLERASKIDPLINLTRTDKLPFDHSDLFDKNKNPKTEYKNEKVSFERTNSADLIKDEVESAFYIPKHLEHYYKPVNAQDAIRIENAKNLAFRIFKTSDIQYWNWVRTNGPYHKYSTIVDIELQRYFDVQHYHLLKQKGQWDESLNKAKATTMLLTQEFRDKKAQTEQRELHMRNQQYNIYNNEAVGFDHMIKNQKNEYDKVLDGMFGEYLKNKKEGLKYTKEKIQEQKETAASFNQIKVTNPYEVLKQSQQAYFEMKRGLKNDDRMKIDIDTYLKASQMDKEYPTFHHSDITEIVDLDNATSQAVHGKYASIPAHLVKEAEREVNSFMFNGKHIFDKNEEEWFEDQIESIVQNFFLQRSKLEKTLTRDELYAVDQDLINFFSLDNVIACVSKNLNMEILMFNLLNDILENQRNGVSNRHRQTLKYPNKQYEFNTKNLKDPNAFFHHMAFAYRLESEHRDKIRADLQTKKKTTGSTKVDETIRNPIENPLGFEFLYTKDLVDNQVYNAKRLEDPEDFMSRYRGREFKNLGRTQINEASTGKEKFEQMKKIVDRVEGDPTRVDKEYRKKASEIFSILKEKADRIDQIDRFNNYMATAGKNL